MIDLKQDCPSWVLVGFSLHTMLRRKDISNGLRETIAHRCGKVYDKEFGVHRSAVRKIIQRLKMFKTVTVVLRSGHPGKFTSRSDYATLLLQNPQELQLGLNVKVSDRTVRKRHAERWISVELAQV